MSFLELELEERTTVPLSLDAFRDLVEHWQYDTEPRMSPPLSLGWDMHRQWPSEGFEIWRDLMREYEPPFLAKELLPGDMRKAVTLDEYEAALVKEWSGFDRAKHGMDMLIVDAMDSAREYEGWLPSGLASEATEAILDDLAARSGAKRAGEERLARVTDWLNAELDFMMNQQAGQVAPMPSNVTPLHSAPLPDLLVSSADFIAGFVAPEYLIDGMVQRRYFYSMTAQTGVGKTSIAMRWMAHVVAGRPIGDREVQEGNVLYLAGENPDDVRARWLVLARDMGIDAGTEKVTWIVGPKDIGQEAVRFQAEATKRGLEFAYVVVDTAAAYNPGDDENSNNQAGAYARQLRSLTNLPGGPCVVVLCHPTKRAGDDDLMPRGGGAFLAEVDGNMAVMRKDTLLAVVPFGKFRGDMSWSQRYEIAVVNDHPKLKDARGRQMRSVLARPVGDGAAAVMEKRTDADMETVLAAVDATPSATATDLARILEWTFGSKGEPNVNRVKRNLARLSKDKLVKETMSKWRTTEAGQRELNAIDLAKAARSKPMFPVPLLPRIGN